jgi:hypothetical protein
MTLQVKEPSGGFSLVEGNEAKNLSELKDQLSALLTGDSANFQGIAK